MTRRKTYPVAKTLQQLEALTHVDMSRVMRRAGLSAGALEHSGGEVSAQMYYALMDAFFVESPDPARPLELAETYATAPLVPAVLAYSCSPDVRTGVKRLSVFKPLVSPMRIVTRDLDQGLEITINASETPGLTMPWHAAAFEVAFLVACARNYSGAHVEPVSAQLPEGTCEIERYADYLGVSPSRGPRPGLVLSDGDAARPLITENSEAWALLEVDFRRQLAERDGARAMADRVQHCLLEALPSGEISADAISRRLNISKRSLQRRLSEEGRSFQSLLDETRAELAQRYLKRDDMSVDEIAYLLAYRDPNSFYRAFQGWTGKTPAEARRASWRA